MWKTTRARELRESGGGRPGLPVSNSPYGLSGRKATLNVNSEHRSCAKVELGVPGPSSLTVLMVSLDIKEHYLLSELWSCVKVEVAVLGSPSLTVLMVSLDVKQHWI